MHQHMKKTMLSTMILLFLCPASVNKIPFGNQIKRRHDNLGLERETAKDFAEK